MPRLRTEHLRRAFSSGFGRAVGVLVGGTALGHAITALALPVLSRLYTPTDFGLLAAFTAVVSILAVAACLRYEIAIALPKHDSKAASLLGVATMASLVVGLVVAVPALLAPGRIAALLGRPDLASALWLVPLCVALAGICAAMQFWYVRQRAFPTLALTRVVQSATASGGQVSLGLLAFGPAGLLAGPVLNSLSGGLCLVSDMIWRRRGPRLAHLRMRRILASARRHVGFPLYSTPEALANAAGIHLPLLLIAALAAPAEAGHLMLAMTVVQAPMALLGNAVGQVYLSRAAEEHRNRQLAAFTSSVVGGLMRNAAGPLLFLGVVAPWAFVPVFGHGWDRGGQLVAWLTPWFVLNLLTAPISMALHVLGRQRLALVLQSTGLLLRAGAILLVEWSGSDIHSEAYAASGALFYAVFLVVVLKAVGCSRREVLAALATGAGRCLAWIAAGILVAAPLAALS